MVIPAGDSTGLSMSLACISVGGMKASEEPLRRKVPMPLGRASISTADIDSLGWRTCFLLLPEP